MRTDSTCRSASGQRSMMSVNLADNDSEKGNDGSCLRDYIHQKKLGFRSYVAIETLIKENLKINY